MRKIPTVFRRDPDNPVLITREVHPDCRWVLDGEGTPTRKYDGTCMGYFPAVNGEVRIHKGIGSSELTGRNDITGVWLARREVKPGQKLPDEFLLEETDETTSKSVGWVPADESPFHRYFCEALPQLGFSPCFGTYELCGPKINGNPEHFGMHSLVRHHDAEKLKGVPTDFDGLMSWLPRRTIEGIVWHATDGRMAKLKVRDVRAYLDAQAKADVS